jgi:hypothetical protein
LKKEEMIFTRFGKEKQTSLDLKRNPARVSLEKRAAPLI